MASSGATMQNYLTDLIQNLESMKLDRTEIQEEINEFEKHRTELEQNIHALSVRHKELTESLEKKRALKNEYVANINEISTAFTKILESSQTLLHVAKKESNTLEKKKEKVMAEDNKDRSHSQSDRHSENRDDE